MRKPTERKTYQLILLNDLRDGYSVPLPMELKYAV